ncbi:UdgX family uracil-DNA binding protein [Nocardioides sp. Kera G14]|uniref:UdgX family uracil-DNA binding protein n=1 Tax=Nocardioides sp. Kera G14 TaxID=2884264 RepID=UPI001D106754|nr:UdgX family uracil-DNA binding protein [Nocardioides sp. Kera G14]UDY24343.1 UdgX family uracil-DNA binding protein [Nocardioides sp. Kera G14]
MSDASPWVPSDPTPHSLHEAAQECRGCELYAPATQVVMGEGRAPARLMLIGEQPGDSEDREGEPFVGPAGELLDRALAEAGIERADAYVTNVVKHFRFREQGKRRIHMSPASKHVRACLPWLEAELQMVQPEGVVLLGGTAGKALYGADFRVGESRGELKEWPLPAASGGTSPWVLTTIHPSAVLRARDDREAAYDGLVTDLKAVAAQLAG